MHQTIKVMVLFQAIGMGSMSFNEECLKGREGDLRYTGKSSMSFLEILQKNGDRTYLRTCQDRVVVYQQPQENKKMERFF